MTTLSLSQTPDAVNLQLRQYQDWNLAFSYCEQDANGNYDLNLPINLTGYTPILQFRENAQSRTAVLELTTAAGGGLTFVANTCPQVQVSAGIDCPPGKYVWDLRCVPTDATESIFLGRGTVIVDAEVSR
jgi:hypothetical protein